MKNWILGAVCASAICGPAQGAVNVTVNIEAWFNANRVTTYSTIDDGTWPEECRGRGICIVNSVEPVHLVISGAFAESNDGTNFTFSADRRGERISIYGTARYLGNGDYEGLTLTYGRDTGTQVGWYEYGGTNQFTIRQVSPPPVPEPSTWAMLILGFGLVGAGMRQRNVLRAQEALAA